MTRIRGGSLAIRSSRASRGLCYLLGRSLASGDPGAAALRMGGGAASRVGRSPLSTPSRGAGGAATRASRNDGRRTHFRRAMASWLTRSVRTPTGRRPPPFNHAPGAASPRNATVALQAGYYCIAPTGRADCECGTAPGLRSRGAVARGTSPIGRASRRQGDGARSRVGAVPEPLPPANHTTRIRSLAIPSAARPGTDDPPTVPVRSKPRRAVDAKWPVAYRRPAHAASAEVPVAAAAPAAAPTPPVAAAEAVPAARPSPVVRPPPGGRRPRPVPGGRRRPAAVPGAAGARGRPGPAARDGARTPRVGAGAEPAGRRSGRRRSPGGSTAAAASAPDVSVGAGAGAGPGVHRVEVDGAPAGHGRARGELPTGQDDRDVDGRAVDLALVHVGDGGLGVHLARVQDVGGPAVVAGWSRSALVSSGRSLVGAGILTESSDGQVHVADLAVLAEYLVEVLLVDVLGQLLDDDLPDR